MVLTIALETDEARAAVEASGDDGRLLLVPRLDGRHATVGTVASIESRGALPSGTPALVVRAHGRARLHTGVAGTGDVLWLEAEEVEPEVTDEAIRLAGELRAAFRALFDQVGDRRLMELLRGLDEPEVLADAAGWWPDLSMERKVELLETVDVAERVGKVLAWVKEALAELELTERIRTEVSDGLEKSQREFLLRQQLAAIRKELGEDGDGAEDGPEAYRARAEERDLPADVRAAVGREIDRLERSNEQSPEHGWIRTWLDTVLELPWGRRSDDTLDLDRARAVLDADHTGLDEVKDRIVEELAVRKLRHERGLDGAGPEAGGTDPAAPEGPGGEGADDDDGDLPVTPPDPEPAGGATPPDPRDLEPLVRIVDLEELERPRAGDAGPRHGDPSDRDGGGDAPVPTRHRHATILTLVGPPGVATSSRWCASSTSTSWSDDARTTPGPGTTTPRTRTTTPPPRPGTATPRSSRSSVPPAWARPASASPWPARSVARSCGWRSAASGTRPRSAGTGAPTWAPAPAASCGP